jgi:Glycosyl transferase family 2
VPTRNPVTALRAAIREIRAELRGVRNDVDALATSQQAMLEELRHVVQHEVRHAAEQLQLRSDEHHTRALKALRGIEDEEQPNRRRLWELRESEEYARPFEVEDPLVSVFITTYTNAEALATRSIPSVLAQTHSNLELWVVGDAASPEVEETVRSFDDPRVNFVNLTVNGPYPDDETGLWQVAGAAPFNEGLRLARGEWIAPNCDDDVLVPNHLETLVAAARRDRLEFVYGRIRRMTPEGDEQLLGTFPPAAFNFGVQASIVHRGLRFLHADLLDATFGETGDWSWVRRMMRIGVRMGMVDDVIVDYYPSQLWGTPAREAGELG